MKVTMPSVQRSALLPYSAEAMYDLVNNIEAYPEFLPWCRHTVVHQRTADIVEASMEIAKGGIHKTVRTRNLLVHAKKVEMHLVEGPFKHLYGIWEFESLGESACKVSLKLDFEFSNALMQMAIGAIFNQIANTLLDAFCQRAKQLYGHKS